MKIWDCDRNGKSWYGTYGSMKAMGMLLRAIKWQLCGEFAKVWCNRNNLQNMLNPELLFIDHQQSVELDFINFNYSLGNKGQSLIKKRRTESK